MARGIRSEFGGVLGGCKDKGGNGGKGGGKFSPLEKGPRKDLELETIRC